MYRKVFALLGAFIFAGVDLSINLLAAAIQEHSFTSGFGWHDVQRLVILGILGIVIGGFLGGDITVPASNRSDTESTTNESHPNIVTVTRLRALLSYMELKGRGVSLSDLFLVGSKVTIDTQEK